MCSTNVYVGNLHPYCQYNVLQCKLVNASVFFLNSGFVFKANVFIFNFIIYYHCSGPITLMYWEMRNVFVRISEISAGERVSLVVFETVYQTTKGGLKSHFFPQLNCQLSKHFHLQNRLHCVNKV